MSASIFISFPSKDTKVAMTLCSALENRGFKCWIAARDIQPGENFQVAIVQAIRRAKIMLLVFTAASNDSEEMTKELALASQQKMIVIPLRVDDVAPSDAFAYEFATRQWIDFFADWEFAIEQLCRRIGHALLERSAGLETNHAADAYKEVIAARGADPAVAEQIAAGAIQEAAVEVAPALEAVVVAPEAAAAIASQARNHPQAEPDPEPEPRAKPAPAKAAAAPTARSSKLKPEPEPAPAAAPAPAPEQPVQLDSSANTRRWALIGAAIVILLGLGLALPKIVPSRSQPEAAPAPAAAESQPLVPPVAAVPAAADAGLAASTNAAAETPPDVKQAVAKKPKGPAAPKPDAGSVDIPF